MSEAAETLDGWYSLHLFYAVDWATFRLVPEDEREAMINEFKVFIENKATAREKQAGDYALYNITGQKADILLWYLRPEMKELNEIENELNKLRIADFFIQTYSYVSVIELGNYLAGKSDEDPMKIHILKQDYIQNYLEQNIFVSIQWINVVMKHITGICYQWKIVKINV